MLNAPLGRRLRMALMGGGGTGFIGKVHRTAAALDGRAELVSGAFSSNADRSRAAAEDFGVDPRRAFADFAELLADEQSRPASERVDFVTIATPNWLHFPMAQAALNAGFHVVCDKPMTISSEQAQTLVNLVESTGRVFVLTHNYTGYPLVRQAREMIASGELGEIRAVRVNYIQGWMRGLQSGQTPTRGAWKDDAERNGPAGTMADVGTHAFNLACYMTGLQPQAVSARLMTYCPGRKLDDYGHALVKCDNDALLMVTASQVTHGRLNDLSIEVDGERAALCWRQEDPNTLIVHRFGAPRQIYDRHPAADYTNASGRSACRLPAGHPEAFFEAFANVYAAGFDDMIRHAVAAKAGSNPACKEAPGAPGPAIYPTVYDGLAGVRFMEQVVASHQHDGAWQPLA